jgi:hypothetical protein
MRGPTTSLGAHRYVEKGRPLEELREALREVGTAKREGKLPGSSDGPPGAPGSGLVPMWRLWPQLRLWPRLGPATA